MELTERDINGVVIFVALT